jgi:cytidine deaminase
VSAAKGKSGASSVSEKTIDALIADARAVRVRAYAPYSRYRVGAALLTASGRVFVGCNVENSSYGGTICAERGAICAMVAAGESRPIACVVVTGGAEPASPCGICRQVLAEFASDMKVVMLAERAGGKLVRSDKSLAALLPDAFRFKKA